MLSLVDNMCGESESVLVNPSRPAVTFGGLGDNSSKSVISFSLKFKLISGHETGARPVQHAAVHVTPTDLNLVESH